ncbi:hypothetical protein ITP53_16775 [Nonomuraea sp. K274]|uniref:Uncharacterized protein n=1 Tax=Nonomuraea cypriaca TaxID=1187855 RepID=A0A931EZB4_9ACTN|nr:hypothetical protein [Nonomuraea cypriaca]MBF8187357.1 hypothetical protein [Nonomuraea cypriaca]
MLIDWIRTRSTLIGELVEAREQAAAEASKTAAIASEADRFLDLLRKEQAAHAATQHALEALEAEGLGDVFDPAAARTPAQELSAMRAHVTALEQRVHLLQRANMAADRR